MNGLLKNLATGAIISDAATTESKSAVKRVTKTSLDGTSYLQLIGAPVVTHTVRVIVTRAMKAGLEAAEAAGDQMQAVYEGRTVEGVITKLDFNGRKDGDLFTAVLTLTDVGEVTVV